MFGMTFEKLFLIALITAVIIGPRRLPELTSRVAGILRQLKGMALEAKRRAEDETGVALVRDDWQALDPRQYDPRRIIREAWQEPDARADAVPDVAVVDAASLAGPAPERPPGRWVIGGTSAHPRRVWVPAEPVSEQDVLAAAS